MSDVLDPEPEPTEPMEITAADTPERADDRFEPVTTVFLVGIGLLLLLCLVILFIGERRPPPGL